MGKFTAGESDIDTPKESIDDSNANVVINTTHLGRKNKKQFAENKFQEVLQARRKLTGIK